MGSRDEIIRFLRILFAAGDVFEVRVLNAVTANYQHPHAESGYFDYEHIPKAADAILALRSYTGAYATLNPVMPALLARANNRLAPAKRDNSTTDAEILRRRWLPIDCDPVRPSGISSDDAEHEAAHALAKEIRDGLSSLGWPEPVELDSGNGAQLLYRIDLPADDEDLVQNALTEIAKGSTSRVKVDLSVFNASRIWRIPGTVNRKGDPLPERPHRQARIVRLPKRIAILGTEHIRAVLMNTSAVSTAAAPPSGTPEAFDADRWIARCCPELGEPVPWKGGRKWVFKVCPFNGDHDNGSAVLIQESSGAMAFRCHHNGCLGNDWRKLRELREPGCYDRQEAEPLPIDWAGLVSMAKPEKPPEPVIHTLPPEQPAASAFPQPQERFSPEVLAKMEEPEDDASESLVETIPFPEELYDIPGLVGDVMKTTLQYSNKPNRPLALAGALALMSYLAARKVKSPTGLRPNVYILALADSGSGKERPRDVNQLILEEIQKDDGLLDRVSSGEGIEDALKAYTSLFWMCDEFYSTLQEMMAEKKDTKDTMMEYLLKLYTNSHKFIKTRAKANLTPVKIRFPHLTLFATTTPDGFFENLREKFLLDGMYARLNVMVAEKGGRGRLPPELDVPQDIIERARLWAHYTPPQAGNLSEQPLAVPYTADAARLADELFEKQEDECEKAKRNEEPQWKISVWNRSCEIALRYALIYACSIALKPEDAVITADAVRWGEKFMWWEIRNKFFLTERHYFRTDFERIAESVIDIMRRWHRKNGEETPMPGWKFNRKTKHLPPNCLNAVVESLGKQQRLFSGAWKNGTIYSLHQLK